MKYLQLGLILACPLLLAATDADARGGVSSRSQSLVGVESADEVAESTTGDQVATGLHHRDGTRVPASHLDGRAPAKNGADVTKRAAAAPTGDDVMQKPDG